MKPAELISFRTRLWGRTLIAASWFSEKVGELMVLSSLGAGEGKPGTLTDGSSDFLALPWTSAMGVAIVSPRTGASYCTSRGEA